MINSWDDSNGDNQNSYSGSIPDGDYDSGFFYDNTQMNYCTYGPSFCILSFFLFLHYSCFNIKWTIVPFPPTNLQLTQKSSTSVDISWTASVGPGVYYKMLTSPSSTQKTKYTSTSITLNSLSPSTTYTFYIYAGKNNPSGGAETYETVGMIFVFASYWLILISKLEIWLI